MIMRLKGYDCSATGNPRSSWSSGILSRELFRDVEPKFVNGNETKDFITSLLANGNNRYGYIAVNWNYGGGHSLVYTVSNGVIKILDGQDGSTYTPEELCRKIKIGATYFTDVTDATPTDYVLGALQKYQEDFTADLLKEKK